MAVVLRNGAIFLHVPKTGGTWITAALRECGLIKTSIDDPHKHVDVQRVLGHLRARRWRSLTPFWKRPRRSDAPPMFCFVRHPVRWYESWFKYMSQPSLNWKRWSEQKYSWHPCAMLDQAASSDFSTFVRAVLANRPGFVTEMYGLYQQPPVSLVGRQENLQDDLIAILHQLGLDFDERRIRNLEPRNVSRSARPIVWDPELLAECERAEYAGLRRYRYAPLSAGLWLLGDSPDSAGEPGKAA